MKALKYLNYLKGILIYFGVTLITELILLKIPFPKNFWTLNLVNLIAPILTSIVLIMVYKDLFKNKFNDFKSNYKKYFSLIFKYWLVGLVFMIITNTIISSITKNIAINEQGNRTLLNSLPLYSIISTIFLAPISEEITFRASIREIFKEKNLYCIASALLFGFAHVMFNGDYLFIIPYASLAFFIAKAYYETDNILVNMLMHSLHNTFCLIIIFLGGTI